MNCDFKNCIPTIWFKFAIKFPPEREQFSTQKCLNVLKIFFILFENFFIFLKHFVYVLISYLLLDIVSFHGDTASNNVFTEAKIIADKKNKHQKEE